jgi:hypothetical protein
MMRHIVQSALLTGILVMVMVPVTLAQKSDQRPDANGMVATITAIDRRTGMATLTTETGEVFALPKETLWHVGSKVKCERVDFRLQRLDAAPHSHLGNCKPWQ